MVMAIIMTTRRMNLTPIAPLCSAALECGPNSHYEACADRCLDSCSSKDMADGCRTCEERCVCDTGYKLSGGVCVPAEDCGCWKDERHYEVRADRR